jgi:hypothetical protein
MSTTIIPGPNVFRAVSGSLFSSPINWSRGYVPTSSDVAMIADNCTIDINRTIGSLVVRSPFTASINTGLTLTITDTINVMGQLSCSGAPTINTLGKTNIINNFLAGTSTFNYYKIGNQSVPGVTYYNVGMYNQGTKTATGNIIVSGNLSYAGSGTTFTRSFFELNQYDLSVLGNTNITNGFGSLSKSQPGRLLFTGQLGYGNLSNVLFTGNPTVEFRGGISGDPDIGGAFLDSGVGTWIFSTNNQSINTHGRPINADIYISGSTTLTIPSGQTLTVNKILTGTSGSSILANSGSLYFNTVYSANNFMTTGSANLSSSANTVGFTGNYDLTIPARFSSSFYSLYISGTGTKTLTTSSYISGTLSINSQATLELSSSNLIVSGATTIFNALSKSGPGSVIFYNSLTGPTLANSIDFSLGNPTVEFRNGFTLGTNHDFNVLRTGTGSWIFTTNNQTIRTHEYFGFYTSNFDAPIMVSGAINLNVIGHFYFNRPFNGTSLSSTLTNSGIMYINFTSSLMPTGTFDYLSTSSILGFTMGESYTIPSGSYRGLFISGSGVKYTSGSLIVSGNLSIAANSQLELGNYNLTVTGSVVPDLSSLVSSRLTKSGSGNIIFNGRLSVAAASRSVDFSLGNPTVECRNGIYAGVNNVIDCLRTGTGSWTFTTNNQILQPHIFSTIPHSFIFDAPLTISGAISVTANSTYNVFYMSRSLDGTEAASRFINNGVVYYYASQQPMLTGSVDFSSSLTNTFIYNSGSQNVKGGVYRNLTFLNGLKTLQGNVSVLGTFSTGSGATSGSYNLNGFTLTNP